MTFDAENIPAIVVEADRISLPLDERKGQCFFRTPDCHRDALRGIVSGIGLELSRQKGREREFQERESEQRLEEDPQANQTNEDHC